MAEDIDPKVVESVYQSIVSTFLLAAKAQGRTSDDAYEVAHHAIFKLMESYRNEPIREPLHWARHTAANKWKDLGRRDRKHVSLDSVEGLTSGEKNSERSTKAMKSQWVRESVREQMAKFVTEHRNPATLAEQRDLLVKIDPDWLKHMEEGYDFSKGKKMDKNTRRRIQRRAKAILEGA